MLKSKHSLQRSLQVVSWITGITLGVLLSNPYLLYCCDCPVECAVETHRWLFLWFYTFRNQALRTTRTSFLLVLLYICPTFREFVYKCCFRCDQWVHPPLYPENLLMKTSLQGCSHLVGGLCRTSGSSSELCVCVLGGRWGCITYTYTQHPLPMTEVSLSLSAGMTTEWLLFKWGLLKKQ